MRNEKQVEENAVKAIRRWLRILSAPKTRAEEIRERLAAIRGLVVVK